MITTGDIASTGASLEFARKSCKCKSAIVGIVKRRYRIGALVKPVMTRPIHDWELSCLLLLPK